MLFMPLVKDINTMFGTTFTATQRDDFFLSIQTLVTMKGILILIADIISLNNTTDDDTLHHITFEDKKKISPRVHEVEVL